MITQRRARHTLSLDRQLAQAVAASKAPAISRAVAILRLLGERDSPLGVHSIAKVLGLAPSTCLYLLRALVAEELVSFDRDTKRYAQEAGVLTIAQQWLRRNHFTELAQPLMDQIGQSFGVTVAGMRIVGLQHIVVVAVSRSNSSIRLSMQIGSRFPALISATGRCVAAFGGHPEGDVETRFKALRWDKPPTFQAWRSQVERTRALGFALDEENYMAGLTVLAAPVWTRGKLSHALVVIGPSGALRRSGLPKLQKSLLDSARILTTQLGGDATSG